MPTEHGRGLNDEEGLSPSGHPPTGENPKPAVAVTQPGTWRPALQHDHCWRRQRFSVIRSALDVNHAAIAFPAHLITLNPLPSLSWREVFHGPGQKERAVDRVLAPYSG